MLRIPAKQNEFIKLHTIGANDDDSDSFSGDDDGSLDSTP